MRLINFEITSEIYLRLGSREIDIHNNYDFFGLDFDPLQRGLVLKWKKAEDPWVPADSIGSFELRFSNLSVFVVSARDPDMPFSEDSCLEFMGYLHPEDLTKMNGYLSPQKADASFHMIFVFQSGAAIKVYAETVHVVEGV